MLHPWLPKACNQCTSILKQLLSSGAKIHMPASRANHTPQQVRTGDSHEEKVRIGFDCLLAAQVEVTQDKLLQLLQGLIPLSQKEERG